MYNHVQSLKRGKKQSPSSEKKQQLSPIGSMYGIYANIGVILMVNVTIYIAYMGPMGHTLSQLSAIIKSPEPMTFPSERGLALRGRRAAGRELLGRASEPRAPDRSLLFHGDVMGMSAMCTTYPGWWFWNMAFKTFHGNVIMQNDEYFSRWLLHHQPVSFGNDMVMIR